MGFTYNVVAGNTVGLAPGAHDVGIVVGQDGDLVNTLGAELGELGNVLGDVVGGANGGESTCRRWRSVENLVGNTGYRRSGDEPGRAKRMTFLLAHSLEAA